MADFICIDGGTTNTRISLVSGLRVIATKKFNVGARKGIDDRQLLKTTIRDGINELLCENGKTDRDIERILASGMITSEFGLVELPHLTTPAGIRELHDGMFETSLSDISPIKFVFIRGVKTGCERLEDADMMRGEETELMGIFEGEGVYILPGSHSKIIASDSDGRITHFKTMLSGEMLASLSQNTILKDAVDIRVNTVDKKYLLSGFNYCEQYGINEALFKVRVLKNIFKAEPAEIYSFYMGIILCDEIKAILSYKAAKIIIGGKKYIKEPTAVLLGELCKAEIITVPDSAVDDSCVIGMVRIYTFGSS